MYIYIHYIVLYTIAVPWIRPINIDMLVQDNDSSDFKNVYFNK